MNLTLSTLRNPAGAAVGICMVLLFGLYCLVKSPIQLFPDIEYPEISVESFWRGASPKEIESEILEPIENVLKGLPGVMEMNATANPGRAQLRLRYRIKTNMQEALMAVISRMNRLPPLPKDATPPIVDLGGSGGGGVALTWFFLQVLPGNPTPVEDFVPFAQSIIQPRLESIPGVSGVDVGGFSAIGTQELLIEFDPLKAAELGISIPGMARMVGGSEDTSAGTVDVGRRRYTLRFAGRYEPEQLASLILEWRNGSPVRLGDVATVAVQDRERIDLSRQNGNPAIGIRIDRESGANVLATLNRVKVEVEKLREGPLKAKGLDMRQSFDASVFIYRAINLVTSNLFVGMMLAIGVLWWFLRRMRATLIVALSIPISLLGTFIVLRMADRSLNVISLAGLAFAVGMVLDAAIVVLENIVRLRENGLSEEAASLQGANQVWGALVASTATTVAVFLPVLFLKDVEGQLFGDLALTIAISVLISLVVAVTAVPLVARQWLGRRTLVDRHQLFWLRITGWIMCLTQTASRRWLLATSLIVAPLGLTFSLMPELDYLPPVKRDAVDTYFRFPPATNLDTIERDIVRKLEERMRPYMEGKKEPALKNYYILVWPGGGGTLGARALDQSRVKELEKIITEEVTAGIPDTQAFTSQGNLFSGFGDERAIQIHMQSADSDSLKKLAKEAMEWVKESMPETRVRPGSSLEEAEPELRLIPNDRSLLEKGWSRDDLAQVTRTLGQGLYVGEYFNGASRMDIILRAQKWTDPETLASTPIALGAKTAAGVVPLSELVDIVRTVGPDQIDRVDGHRTLTLTITPPENMSLEHAITLIKTQVEPKLRAALPPDGSLKYGGSADSLSKALNTMGENFLVAMGILFLLMSALFRSMKDSALVVLSMPLATFGSVVALRLLNLVTFQPLDLLTMIGFVILLGLVVNNAILLVHQTREGERNGLPRKAAVEQALLLRLRPIFMSTLTSLFGMLPLLITPGEGSVIYRGLATAIVGGMSVSTLFTLVLLPCFLRMGETSGAQESRSAPQQAG